LFQSSNQVRSRELICKAKGTYFRAGNVDERRGITKSLAEARSVSSRFFAWLARKLFSEALNMKSNTSHLFARPHLLRMTGSPLLQLFPSLAAGQNDPPAVRAAWLRLYWEIVGKPRRSRQRK
jgi:hypothetical protein